MENFEVPLTIVYSAFMIYNSGGNSSDFKHTLVMTRMTTLKLFKILKFRTTIRKTKLRLINALIFHIVIYAILYIYILSKKLIEVKSKRPICDVERTQIQSVNGGRAEYSKSNKHSK